MGVKEFAKKVIALKNRTITDEVFLLIQNNRGLMKEYLKLVQENKLQTVNQWIGRTVMEEYKLKHYTTGRNSKPTTTLISSYQELEKGEA
jgi:hypothetical protein